VKAYSHVDLDVIGQIEVDASWFIEIGAIASHETLTRRMSSPRHPKIFALISDDFMAKAKPMWGLRKALTSLRKEIYREEWWKWCNRRLSGLGLRRWRAGCKLSADLWGEVSKMGRSTGSQVWSQNSVGGSLYL